MCSALHRGRPGRWPAASAVLAVLLAGTLAGCNSSSRHEIVGSIPDDYRTRHPLVLEERVATMDIPVGLESGRLPRAVEGNIAGFADAFRASGSAVIAIVAPSGSANEVVAARLVADIDAVLVRSGVRSEMIDYRVYGASPTETQAPIRLAYNRVEAHTGRCGEWPDQTAKTGENRNYHNFGCATQQNLAAMVANPLDLLYPRRMTPPDAERRVLMLTKYRTGDQYQTDYGREGGGPIADGVGQ